jgi:hypothetical protein
MAHGPGAVAESLESLERGRTVDVDFAALRRPVVKEVKKP